MRTQEGVQVREVRRCEHAKGRGSQVWVKERRDVDDLACLTAALLRRSTARLTTVGRVTGALLVGKQTVVSAMAHRRQQTAAQRERSDSVWSEAYL